MLIFLVLIFSLIWIIIFAVCSWLLLRYRRPDASQKTTTLNISLLTIIFIHMLIAIIGAIATDFYSISKIACNIGIYGIYISLGLIALEIVIGVLALGISGQAATKYLRQNRIFLIIFVSSQILATLAMLRSALLCTV